MDSAPSTELAGSADVLEAAAAARAAGRFGIDTEFMSEGRYRALLCLVQVAVDNPDPAGEPLIFLIDSLADADVRPLAVLLADPDVEVVLHAGPVASRSRANWAASPQAAEYSGAGSLELS